MTRKIVDVLKYLLLFLMGMILAINLISFFSIYILKSKYSNIFGYSYFEVLTGSMRDEIKEHDIVVVKLNSDFAQGDIITYYSDNNFITHRVQSINEDVIVTKGDANNASDTPIQKNQVIGKVVKIIPNLGIILKLITDKVTILFALGIIIIISYITSLQKRE